MTTLYQLHIDKEIVPDWSGDIYHSRLYHSHQACMEGCLEEEIFEIGKALYDHGDFTEDIEGLDGEDSGEFKNRFEAGDKAVAAYIKNVRTWLLCVSNKPFYGDASVGWNILAFELAGEKSP